MYVGSAFEGLPATSTGKYLPALFYARPLGAKYSAEDMYPFYLAPGIDPPFTPFDWERVSCFESSATAYDLDLGYALCSGGGKSFVLTFSTAPANRGEVVCQTIDASAAHRGWGDISLASDR